MIMNRKGQTLQQVGAFEVLLAALIILIGLIFFDVIVDFVNGISVSDPITSALVSLIPIFYILLVVSFALVLVIASVKLFK